MAKSKDKNKPKSNLELLQSIRRSWGDVNPYTRIESNRKKDKKRMRLENKKLCKSEFDSCIIKL